MNTLLHLSLAAVIGSSCVVLSGCSQPRVNPPNPNSAASLQAEEDVRREEMLHAELAALARKGEILDRTHQYHPFIKVQNIYIRGKQSNDGSFSHSRVVSVPLIYRDQKIQYNTEAVEGMFNSAQTSQTTPQVYEAPMTSAQTMNTTQNTSTGTMTNNSDSAPQIGSRKSGRSRDGVYLNTGGASYSDSSSEPSKGSSSFQYSGGNTLMKYSTK